MSNDINGYVFRHFINDENHFNSDIPPCYVQAKIFSNFATASISMYLWGIEKPNLLLQTKYEVPKNQRISFTTGLEIVDAV